MAMQLAAGGGGQSSRMRCLYIFNRNGVCVHYHVWYRPLSNLNRQEDQKLMFGLLYSLKSFTSKMDPLGGSKAQQAGLPASQGQGCSFHSYKTNSYKLSFMETATGIKIVLLTDPNMGDLREALRYIYSNIYVEFVVKNPLYTPNTPFKHPRSSRRLELSKHRDLALQAMPELSNSIFKYESPFVILLSKVRKPSDSSDRRPFFLIMCIVANILDAFGRYETKKEVRAIQHGTGSLCKYFEMICRCRGRK